VGFTPLLDVPEVYAQARQETLVVISKIGRNLLDV
jgi:hypothetical protein